MAFERLKQLADRAGRQIGNPPGKALRGLVLAVWILGAALLAWLAWKYWPEIAPYLQQANPAILASSFLGYLLSIVSATLGWSLIMRPLFPRLRWGLHSRIYSITLIARRLPGTLWYVGGRLMLYQAEGISKAYVAFASGLEIVVLVATGLGLGLVLLPGSASFTLPALAGGLLSAVFVFSSPRIITWIIKRRGLTLERTPMALDALGWILAFTATWLCGGAIVFLVIRAFVEIDLAQFGYVLGAWAFSGAIGTLTIFLPSSFGLAEISLSLLLSRIIPLPLAGAVAIIVRLLTILYDFAIAAAFYPFLRKPTK